MSFELLSERLAALQESNAQLKGLIDRLAKIKFQPGSVPLGDEEDNVKTELASEINQTIKDQEDDLDLLQEEVIDLNPGRGGSEQQKDGLSRQTKRAIEELNGLKIAFRNAQISSRKSLLEAQRQERKLLLQSYVDPKPASESLLPVNGSQRQNKRSPNLSTEDKEVNASTDVTQALRRTHDMMVAELSRSQFAHDMMQESTAALNQLAETYSTLDSLLSSSKNLLGTLLRSQKSDTWYLETAFYVLAVTIAWLVWRRLLYGPTWWLVWFPLKLFFKAWINVFAAVGLIGGSQIDNTVSSVVPGESIMGSTNIHYGVPSVSVASSVRETDSSQGQGSLSEEVGRIISESQDGEQGGEQDTESANADEAPEEGQARVEKNPKKRMWEEGKEAPKNAPRKRDEL